MAKPRVFVSSTYYDLKHVRASLSQFIETLGFEPILSEKGNIAYLFDKTLDESCYREAGSSSLYVLIIGGRYGSEASESKLESGDKRKKDFYDRYESITKKEYEAAAENGVPIYILLEKEVYAELATYRKNSSRTDIAYAHVDNVSIFAFIEGIVEKPYNNPIFPFDKESDIEDWLRQQWAGTFQELLRRSTEKQQLASLATRVNELGELCETFKTYLELVIKQSFPDADTIIATENERRKKSEFFSNRFIKFAENRGYSKEKMFDVFSEAKSEDGILDGVEQIKKGMKRDKGEQRVFSLSSFIKVSRGARRDVNDALKTLGSDLVLPVEDATYTDDKVSNMPTEQLAT